MKIKERPDSWFQPDEPSKEELWVERRVEELIDEIQSNISVEYSWFDDCIDWDELHFYLTSIAKKEYENLKTEQAISAWEDRQNSY